MLRFSLAAANIGSAALELGRPQLLSDEFHYRECHAHYHRDGFAEYGLFSGSRRVAEGHKQAFCLMDSYAVLSKEGVRETPNYNCGYQGISPGWADDYASDLDCQWVDVTGVAPGSYQLRVEVNADGTLPERDRTNNWAQVDVMVPEFDLTKPCRLQTKAGARQTCGWVKVGTGRCEAGRWARIECE